jgi:hypothetical protein
MKTKVFILVLFILTTSLGFAQNENNSSNDALSEEAKLAKATQNPLAAMYSLPFQNNTTFNVGPEEKTHNVLNIQPVIPVSLTEGINLINRVIIPIITQPYGENGTSPSTGLGDVNYTAWLSPTKASKITWGIGPAFQIPTASKSIYGSGEFGVGPSAVALTTKGQWVAGFVINNIWTFGDIKENKFLFQYFVNYNLPKAWYVVSAPILTANWNAVSGQKWIVPFGGGAGKVFKLGKQPININAQVYNNVARPDGWGDWQARLQVQLLFPKN